MITWRDFVRNEWKSIVRSPQAGQTIGIKILWTVLITLLVAQISAAGYFLPIVLRQVMPGIDPVTTVNHFLWAYFLADFLVRILVINIPATMVHQYLHCNISKKSIARYLMVKSLFNVINVIGIGLWFACSVSMFGFSFAGIAWFGGVLAFLFVNTMLILLVASFRKLSHSILFVGILVAVAGALEYFNVPVLRDSMAGLFGNLSIGNHFAIVFPVLILSGLTWIVYEKIVSLMYIDLSTTPRMNNSIKSSQKSQISDWRMEWLLISRNKRLKGMAVVLYGSLGTIFLIQFILTGRQATGPLDGMMPVFNLAMVFVFFVYGWGQLILISESTFFDAIATLPLSMMGFFRRKFIICIVLLSLGGAVAAILNYLFMDNKYWQLLIALYIYNCGTTVFLVLYRATLQRQRFEINGRVFFNYQGSSFTFAEFLLLLHALVMVAIFFVMNKLQLSYYIDPLFMILGGISLLFYTRWMTFIHESFLKRRYRMMEGFRAKV